MPGIGIGVGVGLNSSGAGSVDTSNKVIILTDWATDVDDPTSIALAIALQPTTNSKLGLVIIDSLNNSGPASVESFVRAYGSDAVIGAYQGASGTYPSYPYTVAIRDKFGSAAVKLKVKADYPSEVVSGRTFLAAQPDASVLLANIGGMVGLANLMASPADGISPLTGIELINQKVLRASIMAGNFTNPVATETNVLIHLASSQYVADNLLGIPVLWSGFEIGANARTRPNWFTDPNTDPLMYAYDVYGAAQNNNLHYIAGARGSFDPIAVDLLLRGNGDRYTNSAGGKVAFNASGFTSFTLGGGNSNHTYINAKLKTDATLGLGLTPLLSAITSPVDTTRKGFYLPLTETTDRFFRDPDAPGWHLLVGAGPRAAATIFPTAVTAPNGTALVRAFDGGDFLGYYGNPYFVSSSWVAGMVFKPTDITGLKYLMSHKGPAPAMWELQQTDGVLTLISWGAAASSTPRTIVGSTPIATGTWYKLIAYHDGTTLQLWLNDVLIGSVAASPQYVNTALVDYNTETGWLQFGTSRQASGAVQSAGFIGEMATLGYWGTGNSTTFATMNTKLVQYAATKGITI